jgi:trehalose 6-phosphate phosphatase
VRVGRGASAAGSPAEEQLPRFSGGWALFLDVDGTLVDFAEHPDAVVVPARLRAVLERIFHRNGGALALVSGRSLADLDRLFDPAHYPIAGQHGLERRGIHGSVTRVAGIADRINDAAYQIQAQASGLDGVVVEHKGLTLAIHYRLAPHLRDWVAGATRALLSRLGDGFGLIEGKMVFEIKLSGKDKGVAIAEFMREAPFAGRLPVFAGDDASDEDGFAVVNALNGLSLKVGPGLSAARWRMSGAEDMRGWLANYADYLDRGAPL